MPKRRAFAMLAAILALCLAAQFAPLSALGEAQPTVVPIGEIVAAYEDNKLAAEDKYGGLWIETTGIYYSIFSMWGINSLNLKVDYDSFTQDMICELDDESLETASLLERGQVVTVRGYYRNGVLTPEITSTRIVSVQPAGASLGKAPEDSGEVIDVSLGELVGAHNDNSLATDREYGGKTLQLTGYFKTITSGYDCYNLWLSESTDLFPDVFCELSEENLAAAEQLTGGLTVTVTGIYESGRSSPALTHARIVDVQPAPTPEPTPTPEPQAVCTMEKFNQVKIGMSYSDVVEIMGGGEQHGWIGANYMAPLWPDLEDTGFCMIIFDENSIVTNKLQHGLD